MGVSLSRFQIGGRPTGIDKALVGAVGVYLGLQTDGCTTIVDYAFLAGDSAVKEVAGVNLNAGLVGEYLQYYACNGGDNLGGYGRDVVAFTEYPVVVIAVAVGQLLIVFHVNACSNGGGCGEVERGLCYRGDFACCHEGAVYRSEGIGIDEEGIISDGGRGISVEIEVGVVGHIQNGLLVGSAFILDVNGIVVGETVSDGDGYIAGKVHVAIGGNKGEFQSGSADGSGFEHFVLPALGTAMQTMTVIVDRQLNGLSAYAYLSLVDAVGITTDGSAKVAGYTDVLANAVKAQHYILQLTFDIGHHNGYDAGTEIGNADFHAVLVGQYIQGGTVTVYNGLEIFRIETGKGLDLLRGLARGEHSSQCHA